MFEQFASVLKLFWQEMGMNSEQIVKLLETTDKSLYPIPESRVLQLLQEADFGNIARFYTGLWYGGWIATKN